MSSALVALATRDSRRCLVLLGATSRAFSTRLRVSHGSGIGEAHNNASVSSVGTPGVSATSQPHRGSMMNVIDCEQQSSWAHPMIGQRQKHQRDDFSTEGALAAAPSSVEATLEQILEMQRPFGEETQESFESVVRSLVMSEDQK